MIALIQRVNHAQVVVNREIVGKIDRGILALIGVEKEDSVSNVDKLIEKLIGYRIFSDQQGKMNLSLADTCGGLLLVPQFTLVADTKKGMRPSFSTAAPPSKGEMLFDYMVQQANLQHQMVQTGAFGADMQVNLCNDGPVTFWLQV